MTPPDTPTRNDTPSPEAQAAPDLVALAALAGKWAEVASAATAGIVAAEVAMLKAVLAPHAVLTDEEKAEAQRADDLWVEADFDNMPL